MIKTGIITVTYNVSKLLTYQVECFKKYCTDDYELIVIDNSNDIDEIYEIKNICFDNGIRYVGTYISVNSGNIPSTNHGLALNYAHKEFKSEFDYLFFIDHDLFPVKKFSVKGILGKKIMAGPKIRISNKTYMWPGCLMMKKLEETFDFTPKDSLDTGGQLSDFISKNIKKILFIDWNHQPLNIKFNNNYMHDFYDDIHNGTFIHHIKSSNWCNVNKSIFNSRQDHLLNVLESFIN
jgi:glycosyltransferase involved in cell wall biosynthesis